MKLFGNLVLAALLLAPAATSLSAQATAPGLWPERPLTPEKKELRDAIIIVRDTLRDVRATVNRMERAANAGSPGVLASSARVLSTDCERATRAAVKVQSQVAGLSTSDKKGDQALADFRRAALALQQGMTSCTEQLATATTPSIDATKVASIRSNALKVVVDYENSVHALMKTLSIPLDPKGHKSAIEM